MTEPTTGSLPQTIGRYEIVRELGRGGMAVVYLARQPELNRLVALKEMATFGMHDPQMVHRFVREAHLAGSLNDPHIVTVHDSFVIGGVPYIAMEYIAPGSLRPAVGQLRVDQSIAVMHDVLAGLAAAGRRGIVHRDLKPENLLVTEAGRVKIADFGIAKAVDHVATTEFATAAGTTVGTPTYMAPEQAMGKDLTPANDLYSLGVIAYELMVGRLPFEAESPVALLLRHVTDAPPPPLSVNPALDPDIGAWIERLLVKDPEARTPSAEQAWDELEDIVFRLVGHRWRREATIPDPRIFTEQPPAPEEIDDVSRYLTVDPSRFEPGRPPTGRTDDQATAVARERQAPPPPPAPQHTPAPAAQAPPAVQTPPPPAVPGPWTPPPSDAVPSVPGPWTPPPSDVAQPPPAGPATPPPDPWTPSGPPRAVPAAWSPAAPGPTTPPELDVTVAPSHPLPTPEPLEAARAPRRAGKRRAVWLGGLLALATVAAGLTFMFKPSSKADRPSATPTATSAAGGTPAPAAVHTSDAFTFSIPGEWQTRCFDQHECEGAAKDQFRSAFVKGSGIAASTLVIDRTRFNAAAKTPSLNTVIAAVHDRLAQSVAGYRVADGSSTPVTLPQKRAARELSFRASEAPGEFGSVFAFKHRQDVYVVMVRGPEASTVRNDALSAAASIEPR